MINLNLFYCYFYIACLFGPCLAQEIIEKEESSIHKVGSQRLMTAQEETQTLQLIKDFFDEITYPTKSFASFMEDLIIILKNNPKYKAFCEDLEIWKNSTSPLSFAAYFATYEPLIPRAIKNFLTFRNPEEVRQVVKRRMKYNRKLTKVEKKAKASLLRLRVT
jgi:hypothetical protein